MASGYCPCSVPFEQLPEFADDVKFVYKDRTMLHKNIPVARSLGPHVVSQGCDLVEPIHAPNCADGFYAGARRRVGRKLPTKNKMKLKRFRDFVLLFVQKHFDPLPPDTDFSFDTWIDQTNYPEKRKERLREVHESMIVSGSDIKLTNKDKVVKCFIKRENYNKYKPARWIMARKDNSKVVLGPIFKAVEKVVFKHPNFIKHIPVSERPQYIYDHLNVDGKILVTDYTSFESQFSTDILSIIEFQLYKRMLEHFPEKFRLLREVLGGTNFLASKYCNMYIRGRRMSGEMNTSLGNGFSNWMLMEFLCKQKGSTMKGVFEGDDGLCVVHGPVPTVKDAEECGFVLKMEEVADLSEGSFCGLIFDPVEKINVRDPVHVLLRFGWTLSSKRMGGPSLMRSLLKAKSFSLLYETPACPILSALAMRLLSQMTDVIPVWNGDWWERQLRSRDSYDIVSKNHEPGLRTRLLVQRRFGISISTQLRVEDYFSTYQLGTPLCDESIEQMLSEYKGGVDLNHVYHFSRNFVYKVQAGEPWRNCYF